MGFWKQFFDAFEKEYRLNGEHPVDKYECKRREERRRARELEWQRNHVYLCLPKWWEKKYKNRPDELRSAVFKLKEASCIAVGDFYPQFGEKRCERGARSAECLQRAA